MTSQGEDTPLVVKPAHKKRGRLVTVEPIVFMILAVQGGFVALRTLFIEHRLALQYNYTLPTNGNTTCGGNHTEDYMQAKIESETAIWVMYMKGISLFLPAFVALFYGAASDFIGRKPILILSATGHLTASALFLGVSYFNLPLVFLVVAEVVLGICGDTTVLTSTAYAYVSDIYENKERSFRIFLVNFLIYVGFGVIQYAATAILQYTNSYNIAYVTIFGLAVINFLYTAVPRVVLETVEKKPFSRGILRDLISKMYLLFKNNNNGRRTTIVLLLANMVLYELVYEAVYSVITIYGLGPPFCWSYTFVGIYGLIVNTLPAFAAILAGRVFGLCMSEYWMIYIGFLSGIGMMVTTSLAQTTPVLAFVATAVGIFRLLPSPLLKYLVAQQVDSHDQGTLFGAAALLSAIGQFLSPLLLNGIYAGTVTTGHPNIAFYVAAGVLVIPMFINGIIQVRQLRPGFVLINSTTDDEPTNPVQT